MSPTNYIPKEATQQNEFLKKYPNFDGRGIKIAIIDSDIVDRSLPGMQKTTTGIPKIIDCIGQSEVIVDTSKIVERNGKNYITGLSGRKLKIPTHWKNPSDKWHLGCKRFKEIYEIDAEVYCKGDVEFEKKMTTASLLKDYIIDCIVWFDGKKWRACIDTSATKCFSNLENEKVLTNFDGENEMTYLKVEYSSKEKPDLYCINITDNGNSLQILRLPDDHGTWVSHIASAYFPDKPECNSLAPGAQIVSFDAHCWMKSPEKTLLKCIEYGIDIVNFSVGFNVTSSIAETISKMVNEHGIIITMAAGNDGPFYTSMFEKRSEIDEYVFFIGAMFDSEMKEKFRRTESANSVFKFSSKGPFLSSGARGIDFVAPGAAMTDLPKWCSKKNEGYYYGTSCSAPNAAGSIACLLSALKANKILYSPAMIKMALANTALLPESADKLSYGYGIIQILDAFEFIKKFQRNIPPKCSVSISVNESQQKGIIWIQNNDKNNNSMKIFTVKIDPTFNASQWILRRISSNDKSFVSHPVTATDNSFSVKIDTSTLEEGSINYAEISGIDSTNPSIGPLFFLPITVICPAKSFIDKEIMLKPGPPTHFFFKIPSDSQQCFIKITSMECKKDRKISLKYRQKRNSCWCARHHITKAFYDLKFTSKKKTRTLTFKIDENENDLFEICIYHRHLSTVNFKMDVDFRKSTL